MMKLFDKNFLLKNANLLTLIVSMAGVVSLALISTHFSQLIGNVNYSESKSAFDQLTNEVQESLDSYIHGLQGMAGIYTVTNYHPTLLQIKKYAASRNYFNNFYGAVGFGFIRPISANHIQNYEKEMQKQKQNFKIYWLDQSERIDAHDRFIIETIEPYSVNSKAQGLDIGSEVFRRKAAFEARINGQTTMSHQVQLVQSSKKEAGFLIFHPVYSTVETPKSEKERLQYFQGWAYTPITVNKLLEKIFSSRSNVQLEIYDQKDDLSIELIQKSELIHKEKIQTRGSNKFSKTVDIGGRKWLIKAEIFNLKQSYFQSLLPFIFFILSSFLLVIVVYYIKTIYSAKSDMESWNQTILNASPFSIISTDRNGIITTFNPAAERMLGYSANEMIHQKTPAVFHDLNEIKERARTLSQELGTQLEPGFDVFIAKAKLENSDACEWSYIRKDGSRFPVILSVSALRDRDNKIIGYVGIGKDITIEKELNLTVENQRAQILNSAKLSSLGEMAAGMAHEINNPLAIIHGKSIQLQIKIQKKMIDEKSLLVEIKQIEDTATRIANIIKGLKLFSRNSENDQMAPINLNQIIGETLELSRQRLHRDSVKLIEKLHADCMINCLPSQISQVLMNLLNNSMDAITHLPDKWIQIETRQENDFIILSVMDSGNGIPESLHSKIMQPFFTTKEVGKGTGLGLSISKGIIESHHGKFEYNISAKNTEFIIQLPIHKNNKGQLAS